MQLGLSGFWDTRDNTLYPTQGVLELRRGEPPFYDLGKLGGGEMMRGYYEAATGTASWWRSRPSTARGSSGVWAECSSRPRGRWPGT